MSILSRQELVHHMSEVKIEGGSSGMEDNFKRKSPEEMLRMISKLQEGTLKIYIGPVSGSGKTYHMLRDGNDLREQGVDVVICAVSTMRRPETVEQLGELERAQHPLDSEQ